MNKSLCHSIKKSKREQIALVVLYKRTTVIKSLSLLFKKRLTSVICTWFAFALKKPAIRSKTFVFFTMFLTVFPCFSSFYAQEQIALIALCSVTLLYWFFTKEWLGVNCSHCYFQKSDREWFSLVTLYKRTTGAICSF